MGRRLKNLLFKLAIKKALRRKSPERIPLSGDRVKVRDYYTAHLGDQEDRWRFVVLAEAPEGFSGLWFTEKGQPPDERVIPFGELHKYQLLIIYYYRELEITYSSAIEFLLHGFVPYASMRLAASRASWRFVNRRALARARRMKILEVIHDKSLEDWDYTAGAEAVMTEIYGHRWRRHPDNVKLYRYYQLALESLVQTGDLSHHNEQYSLNAKALETLARAEQEDRVHNDTRRQNTAMKWLTFALVAVGIVQATIAGCQAYRQFPLVPDAPAAPSQPAPSTPFSTFDSPSDDEARQATRKNGPP